MGKKGPLWWRESDWLLRGSSAANQILLRHSGPILSYVDPVKVEEILGVSQQEADLSTPSKSSRVFRSLFCVRGQ